MKRKLRIDELSVASFATEAEDMPEQRGTVRGNQFGTVIVTYVTCGQYTCLQTCPQTCHVSCQSCITCQNAPCP